MRLLLLYSLAFLLSSTEIYAGGCCCCCAGRKKYVKLNPRIREYLEDNLTPSQKHLYNLVVDTLNTEQNKASFFGEYQFAGEGKIKHALYKFYENGRLPKNENILSCFLYILSQAKEQKIVPEISKDLEEEHEKIAKTLEEINLPTELELIPRE